MPAAATPEAVRETARNVLSRDYYDLEDTIHPFPLAGQIYQWIREKLEALEALTGWLDVPILPLLFWGLMVLILGGLIVWFVLRLRQESVGAESAFPEVEAELDDLPSDVRVLLQRSQELAEAGNYVDASRMLYRAALLRLEEERGGFVRRGLTNTEYLRTFRTPWVIENLKVFADLINWKWYRDRRFEAADYRRCRDAYERLDAHLREVA